MADEFLMPKLGLTMESGTIVNWLVDDGTQVEPGQPLLIIETDKVESEVESTGSGLFHHVGDVGQEYRCGAHIGWLLGPEEAVPAAPVGATAAVGAATAATPASAAAAPASSVAVPTAPIQARAATGHGGRLLASPNARRLAATRGIDLWTVTGTGPGGRITSEDVPEQSPSTNGTTTAPVPSPALTRAPTTGVGTLATAAARSLADLLGIDVGGVAPAGADPRVTKEDVAAHVRALLAQQTPATTTQASGDLLPAFQPPSSVIPMTGIRAMIAERMSQSIHSMAQLTLTMDVDMDGVIADRASRKDRADDEAVPGYTDYVIAAVATALVDHPLVNSQITDDGVVLLPQVNVGMAVALDEGLIVPVINDTPSLALEELAAETTRLATLARSGGLKLPDLEGGTFSVTALGMFDVDGFTPIINAPNTAILGVGRLRDDVAWSDLDSPVRSTRLTLSLTWDHRAFDGAPAAEFARSIKTNLEAY